MREDLLPITWEGKLARLIEELGEVLKAYGKLNRFGEYATDPVTSISYQNKQDLLLECLDLQNAIQALIEHNKETDSSIDDKSELYNEA